MADPKKEDVNQLAPILEQDQETLAAIDCGITEDARTDPADPLKNIFGRRFTSMHTDKHVASHPC
jgi:hypothetical protein